jgi:hypothetical protein
MSFSLTPGGPNMDAIALNNKGVQLLNAEDFAGALGAFEACLRIKRAAYPPPSIHVCLSLSGLADAHLGLAAGAKGTDAGRRALAAARGAAEEHLALATALKSPEQQRIAREVLADVAKAEGGARPPRDPAADSLQPTVFTSGGGTVTSEPPTRRCFADACAATEDLKVCTRCERVYYCSVACQRASWPEHKPLCVRPG